MFLGSISVSDVYSARNWLGLIKICAGLLLGYPQSLRLGAAHADESLYLFSQAPAMVDWLPRDQDKDISRKMVRLWTNFAKNHDPNEPPPGGEAEWQLATEDSENKYFVIDREVGMEERPEVDRFRYWA